MRCGEKEPEARQIVGTSRDEAQRACLVHGARVHGMVRVMVRGTVRGVGTLTLTQH